MLDHSSSAESSERDKTPRMRRWLQFSLRSLLIVTVLCAIGAAWLGRRIEQKRREMETVKLIKANGGTVVFDYERDQQGAIRKSGGVPNGPPFLRRLLGDNFFSEVDSVDFQNTESCGVVLAGPIESLPNLKSLSVFNGANATDADMEHIQALSRLERLDLSSTHISDIGLTKLTALRELKYLDLAGTKIADDGIGAISALSKLENLCVYGTNVGDIGVARLDGLSSLKYLDLSRTKITDAAAIHVARFPSLEELHLQDTDIGDLAVERLETLRSLRVLNLSGTNITDVGLKRLKGFHQLTALDLEPTCRQPSSDHDRAAGMVLRFGSLPDNAFTELKEALPNCSVSR